MKFIYADSQDVVDPEFDFDADRESRDRTGPSSDVYPHEYFESAPYDGLLVSRAIVQSKYSHARAMRFRRDGARQFLRYSETAFPGSIVMGDCGSFSYAHREVPPFTPEDTVEFYADGAFTHGCSIDHVIFDFDDDDVERKRNAVSQSVRDRFDVTLELASKFLPLARKTIGRGFVPVGVIQGWSAPSMAIAAKALVKMGYTYLAVGGLVPLRTEQIERALASIRSAIPTRAQLHLLGFGKIDDLPKLAKYGIASFDSASPLRRAFKDGTRNYFAQAENRLDYYTAVRVPQATVNRKLKHKALEGSLNQEHARRLEDAAMTTLRQYAMRRTTLAKALDSVVTYASEVQWNDSPSASSRQRWEARLRSLYERTLHDRPWEQCECRVCRECGIETVIYRSSNRNKRRGFHNMFVLHNQLQRIRG